VKVGLREKLGGARIRSVKLAHEKCGPGESEMMGSSWGGVFRCGAEGRPSNQMRGSSAWPRRKGNLQLGKRKKKWVISKRKT